MNNTNIFVVAGAAVTLLASTSALALSPPDPTANIGWNAGGNNGVAAIEAAFSNARRTEETQLGVTANAMGNLDLPAQAVWVAMTAAEKALFITNAERVARHNVNYPNHGTVLGLPFEGVESHLNKMAQDYADYMAANNFWAHGVPNTVTAPPFAGSGSFNRITNHPVIGGACAQFLGAAENLHASASSGRNAPTPTTLIEGAIYGWLYNDGGSAWGHRRAMLLQDRSLSGGSGFNNDRGSAASEGFMGIGFAGRGDGSYTVFNGTTFPSQWNVVWVVMDPSPRANCNYGLPVGKQLPNGEWRMISLPSTPPANANTVAAILGDDIQGTYGTQWQVWGFDESNGATGNYVDPGLNGVLMPGKAYWILQRTGNTVTLDMPVGSTRTAVVSGQPCGTPSLQQGCFVHALTAKNATQWNMLGNPFYTRPSINNLRVSTNSGLCADTDACTLAEAADQNGANVQHNRFWTYSGTGYDTVDAGGSFQPWSGYWSPVFSGANSTNPRLRISRN